ncbi:hypothetical protein KBI31_00325 [Patescibacteria group bacterium]|mgnify:CR=1 FL=1|jgi:bisphosphoglycerate-independent phosphoglycerate mutase (AlkP superfamily)|nr:hypothetical protein [Patescibacteria group bacterium]HPD07695.1 hypothetical protein [bacterium]HRT11019.1 hypothetical protein [Patescibacteria group bacterium]HRU89718.1 hypothetical protein [Patescibacteria group bacterium]
MSQVVADNKMKKISPVVLVLLDGWGIAPPSIGNMFSRAHWPHIYNYLQQYPIAALASPLASNGTRKVAYWQIGSGQEVEMIPGLGGVVDRPGLTELLVQAGLRQAYIGESETFPLVVEYLANHCLHNLVDYLLVSTPVNNDYNKNVLSASHLVIERAAHCWWHYQLDFMVVSLASWALVSRYGDESSVVKAIVAMDRLLPKLINPLLQAGVTIILTSAYGILENYLNPLDNKINHGLSGNPTPLVIIGRPWRGQSLGETEVITTDLTTLAVIGSLRSIAPTILTILGIEKPDYMTDPLLPATAINR